MLKDIEVSDFCNSPGADPGGGRWGGRPPLERSFAIQNALFNSIQAPVHPWAPTPGRNPVSAPAAGFVTPFTTEKVVRRK